MIVRIKGVKIVRSKGRVYYYHRRTLIRLPGDPGSTEFTDRLLLLEATPKPTVAPGTLGDLFERYKASPEFITLADNSKRQYNTRFGRLKPFAGLPVASITPQRLYSLRDRFNEKHSRSAANTTIAMLKILFDWSIKRGFIAGPNPAALVDSIRRPKGARTVNRPWSDAELETVLAAAPPWLKIAVAVAAYTGLRESDVANATWASYDGAAFETRQIKTGKPVWIPAHRRLKTVLDTLPRTGGHIVVGIRGKPMTGPNLGSRFFHFLAGMRATGGIGDGLSFHGLRHTLATRLAEAGCDPATIAAVTGHSSHRMTETYTRTANRKHLARAAFDRLEAAENGKPEPGKTENPNVTP